MFNFKKVRELEAAVAKRDQLFDRLLDHFGIRRGVFTFPFYSVRDYLDQEDARKKQDREDDRIRRIARQELIAADVRKPEPPAESPDDIIGL
jgi:hypothetical protein